MLHMWTERVTSLNKEKSIEFLEFHVEMHNSLLIELPLALQVQKVLTFQ